MTVCFSAGTSPIFYAMLEYENSYKMRTVNKRQVSPLINTPREWKKLHLYGRSIDYGIRSYTGYNV